MAKGDMVLWIGYLEWQELLVQVHWPKAGGTGDKGGTGMKKLIVLSLLTLPADAATETTIKVFSATKVLTFAEKGIMAQYFLVQGTHLLRRLPSVLHSQDQSRRDLAHHLWYHLWDD